jgi:hypothetical protein
LCYRAVQQVWCHGILGQREEIEERMIATWETFL